ncbi:MAG: phosphatidylinositol-specific phospholipase C domain-containing protein [Bacteroidia bacterium]|nr:phosphatidylinositol-specific phospholipase C domain-containing protein [Bacteroidia bacterium]
MRLTTGQAQCNCHLELCAKRYNEIAYLTTHNAFNSKQDHFMYPNQTFSITRQLTDGVRALMIDVYDKDGIPTVYHGNSLLGSAPLSSNLNELSDFLKHNTKEVVTIIFECYVGSAMIEQALQEAGLLSMVYTKSTNTQWPTLQELISTNKRLLIFSDKRDASPNQKWYHYVWDYAVETSFSAVDTSDLKSSFNRGNATNDLFILNHFLVSKTLGTGSRSNAKIANSNPFMENRINTCRSETAKFPNFITVDFYDIGDGMENVNKLNQVETLPIPDVDLNERVTLSPNPLIHTTTVQMPKAASPPFYSQLYSFDGKKVGALPKMWDFQFQLDRNALPDGIYLLMITDVKQRTYSVKVIAN